MAKRLAIDALVSEPEHSNKRRKWDATRESGGCMAYALWKLDIFGRCELDDVKKALNAEIGPVFRILNNNRKKNNRVHSLSAPICPYTYACLSISIECDICMYKF